MKPDLFLYSKLKCHVTPQMLTVITDLKICFPTIYFFLKSDRYVQNYGLQNFWGPEKVQNNLR